LYGIVAHKIAAGLQKRNGSGQDIAGLADALISRISNLI
jgi:hypothetical protein